MTLKLIGRTVIFTFVQGSSKIRKLFNVKLDTARAALFSFKCVIFWDIQILF